MRISVIMPSYNQAAYLEQAIRSVLDQDHADVELIVVDGGSTDGAVDVIRSHARRIAYWTSGPDQGQADAINKGMARMSGDVWMYVNSDDLLLPGALAAAAAAFQDPAVEWVGGGADVFDERGPRGEITPALPEKEIDYLRAWNRPHPYVFAFSGATLMRRRMAELLGPFDPGLHYSMDIDYYLRAHFRGGCRQTILPRKLAAWRWHEQSKTMQAGLAYGFREDEVALAERYLPFLSPDEQRELAREIGFEKKQLVARKACYLRVSGRPREAGELLFSGLAHAPQLLFFRPWWGALRRVLLNQ